MDEFVASPRRVVPLLCALFLSSAHAFAQAQHSPSSTLNPAEEGTAVEEAPPAEADSEAGSDQVSGTDGAQASSVPETSTGETEDPVPETAPVSGETARQQAPPSNAEGATELAVEETDAGSEDAPPLIDAPEEDAPIEDEDDWLKWPFSKKNQSDPKQSEPHRWGGGGGFVGWVSRPSQSDSIKYRPGIAWGGFVRAELVSWLGLRLFYREERIPVQVEPGAFDYEGDTYEDDFEQPDLEMLNLGARLEPTLVVHPRIRVRGIVGWSWSWFQAPFPKSEDFELKRTFRSAVQMDIGVGAGLSLDIIENWVDISLDSVYSVPAGRTGTAYEPAQIVRDGGIQHIAPLPKLHNSLDCLISLGVIL